MKKFELEDKERLAENSGHQGFTRREFLTTGSAVAAGLALSVDSNSALAAQKSKKNAGSDRKAPKTMLVKNATVMVTMDGNRREIADGGLYIEDGIIKQVGPTSSLPKTAEEVLDLKGHILLPGPVSYTHLTLPTN